MGFIRGGDIVEVFLFADNEKMEFLRGPYCGGEEGAKHYEGDYQLISAKNNVVVSTLSLGKDYYFVGGQIHDGMHKFAVPNTGDELIAIYQYRGCNGDEVVFYRVDKNGRLNKVLFLNKDGTRKNNQYTSDPVLSSDDQTTFCGYNNAVGYVFCDSYRYNGENFAQAASWMTQELYRSPKTLDGDARRALFEFLIKLYHGKNEGAVYYYGGPYDELRKHNPDVEPNDRVKLFERYCTVNGGVCLIPERLEAKGADPSGEMKFTVSFITRDFKDARVAGKSQFEFRVKQVGVDFKVLDLPPRSP